jgi:hypothetical protein
MSLAALAMIEKLPTVNYGLGIAKSAVQAKSAGKNRLAFFVVDLRHRISGKPLQNEDNPVRISLALQKKSFLVPRRVTGLWPPCGSIKLGKHRHALLLAVSE